MLLLPQTKRSYAQAAFSGIIDLVRLHSSTSVHVEAGGWGDCLSAQNMYAITFITTIIPVKKIAVISPQPNCF
jgi:hypothetical protein